jgi:outer membrane protein OmpA-like peptidoglycan-associated protein
MLVWPGKQWRYIEEDVTSRTSEALLAAGYENIGVTTSGRDVILSGDLSASTDVDKVLTLASAVSDEGGRIAPRKVVWEAKAMDTSEPPLDTSETPDTARLEVNEAEEVAKSIHTDVLDEYAAKFINAKAIEEDRINALPEEKRQCQVQLNEIKRTQSINFASNESQITAASEPLLKQLADILQNCPSAQLTIEGHTDNSGDEALNLALSQRRAEAVLIYFRDNASLRNQINAIGFGETRPIASNLSPSGKAKNRRIQFVIK